MYVTQHTINEKTVYLRILRTAVRKEAHYAITNLYVAEYWVFTVAEVGKINIIKFELSGLSAYT